MNIEQCPSCRGKKKILSLGNIIKDCVHCKGIGHVEKKVAVPDSSKDNKYIKVKDKEA